MPAKQLIVVLPTQGSGSSVCSGADVQLRSRVDADRPAKGEWNVRWVGFARPKTTLWFLCVVLMFCLDASTVSRAQTLTTLTSFNGTDGASPWSLVQGIDGNFYGTTQLGGATNVHCSSGGCGTVFKITPTGTLTTLYSFCAQGGNSCPDGDSPYTGLVQGADGNFYGTTDQGGANCLDHSGCGTFFEITPTGTLTTLYSFAGGANGSGPFGELVQAANGSFYGTTALSGAHNAGTVFTITSAGALTTLYSFCAQPGCADGQYPYAGLVQGVDGNFYGTTYAGGIGTNGPSGTLFKITPTGQLTTLHSFCANGPGGGCPDGYHPHAGLVQALDGNFYGTTTGGGAHDLGIIFKITPTGTLTTLYSFTGNADGFAPSAGLVQATDGNFYGTASGGGTGARGTVFGVTSTGVLVSLHSFCAQPQCQDGGDPVTALLQGTDGNFYGTTSHLGAGGGGTVYKMNAGLNPFVVTQPTTGLVGTPITILGTNLTGATGVTFNATPATILTNTGSAITTTVPVGATTGTVQVALPGRTLSSHEVFQVSGPFQFVPVTPCRLLDTRQTGGPIPGGTSESFTLPGAGGCNIPTSGAVYSLNVTVSPRGPLGYLTIWPQGEIQPFVSSMNSADGRVKANAVIVPGSNNKVSVYVTDTTDLILDVDGYFQSAGSGSLQFYPLIPCRVVDTRQTNFPPGLGAPSFGSMETRALPVFQNSGCLNTLTQTPLAYSFNVTVVPAPAGQPLGYLTIWPSDEQQPVVSTLNNPTATLVANAAIVGANPTNGEVKVFTSNSTDVIIDVNGYFAAPGTGGLSLYSTTTCRVIDTRKIGNGQPFTGALTPPVDVVDSPCGIPVTAQAYVSNATVVPSPNLSYLTLWPDGEGQPIVSTLNAADGWITSNMAIVPNVNGKIDAYAAGLTQLILDISGYFAP